MVFLLGMHPISLSNHQLIIKNTGGLLKVYTVLTQVLSGLFVVPVKVKHKAAEFAHSLLL